ncbi:UNVERIFIED_CONTAM: rluF [Trichonephila clavipes]
MSESHLVRLNKFISDTGYCSRREADALIAAGKVTVNGQSAEMGLKVGAGDTVLVDGKPLKNKPKRVYIAYHKPVGITCTTERKVAGNIIDALKYPERIFPIGRLDKPSEGLIFLTNDGDIVNKVLRAGNAHEKEYVVTVNKPITEHFIKRMSQGVPILDTVTLPCKVRQVSRNTFNIILTQGLNRQIRRMAEFLGYEVVKLKRTRIMHVRLAELKVGQWRLLDAYEVAELEQLVQHSSTVAHAVTNNALNQDHEE